jgi:hypothetical protein
MPFLKLNFRPGIVKDTTDYANEGGFSDCDKVRFFSGFPQKIGGWLKVTPTPFLGVCRQMWNWITSFSDNFLAVGTNIKVYIEVGGLFYNITPLRTTFTASTTPSSSNSISTTLGSTTVVFTLNTHGCETGSYVTISGVTGDPGGVPDAEINKEHEVVRIDSDNFSITVTTAATSTTSAQGGTGITIACQINPGLGISER